jgi:hypothetical protein
MSTTATRARFALPDGWNYGDLRNFLESELQEDFGSDYNWIWLRDFTDTDVYYTAGDGDLIQRPYTIANGDAIWGQPTEVVARTIYQPVASMAAFALATFAEGADGYVLRTGKIFEAAEYADKGFAITPEELAAAAADFRPVPNNIEHGPCVLDGKLGELRAVEARGKDLFGTVAIPRWLHETIGDKPLKVSLEWIRKTKRIVGNALVLNPRVPDAALMAAFSADFAGKRHSDADQRHLDTAHDELVAAGASCGGKSDMSLDSVSIVAAIRALVTGRDPKAAPATTSAVSPARAEETSVTDTGIGTANAVSFAQTQEYKDMQAELARLRDREETRERERTAERAAAFADAEIAASRAYPAERATLIAAFTEAAEDDRANPREVTFSVGEETKKGTRVDALLARHAARTPHTLTGEQVRDGGILPMNRADQGAAKMAADRKERLLSLTGIPLASNAN